MGLQEPGCWRGGGVVISLGRLCGLAGLGLKRGHGKRSGPGHRETLTLASPHGQALRPGKPERGMTKRL